MGSSLPFFFMPFLAKLSSEGEGEEAHVQLEEWIRWFQGSSSHHSTSGSRAANREDSEDKEMGI